MMTMKAEMLATREDSNESIIQSFMHGDMGFYSTLSTFNSLFCFYYISRVISNELVLEY